MLTRLLMMLGLLILPAALAAEERPPTAKEVSERGPFVEAVANLRRIRTPNGIEVLRQARLGGVDQWITIRGRDRANPVLLVIHGGPGTPAMPLSWAYQSAWEDYFTVVNWDQRGAGKNWQPGTPEALTPTLSSERLVADAAELVDQLRREFGQPKIVVLGFSYGSLIGAKLAMRRPEAVAAYVGVGQFFDGTEADVYAGTLARARAAGDREAVAALEALAPHPRPDGSIEPRKLGEVRRWVKKFGGGWYGWPDLQLLYQLPILSPEYDAHNLTQWPIANGWFGQTLSPELATGGDLARQGYAFRVPVIFFMGRHDLMTPYATARRYFDRIEAPSKRFVTFENSAHFIMLEEPGRFLVELLNTVGPFTSRRAPGEAAPPPAARR